MSATWENRVALVHTDVARRMCEGSNNLAVCSRTVPWVRYCQHYCIHDQRAHRRCEGSNTVLIDLRVLHRCGVSIDPVRWSRTVPHCGIANPTDRRVHRRCGGNSCPPRWSRTVPCAWYCQHYNAYLIKEILIGVKVAVIQQLLRYLALLLLLLPVIKN